MPYSGADDPDLPSGVKKKPAADRAQWVKVFNSVYAKSGDDGRAAREAYGVTKELAEVTRIIPGDKSGRILSGRNVTHIRSTIDQLRNVLKLAGVDDAVAEEQVKEFTEKCGMDYMPMPMEPGNAYGGATTFDEVDAYEKAMDQSEDLAELSGKFQAIFQNIMASDMSADERAAAVAQASSDFADMATKPDDDDDKPATKERSLMGAIRSLFKGSPDQERDDKGRWTSEGPGGDTGQMDKYPSENHRHEVLNIGTGPYNPPKYIEHQHEHFFSAEGPPGSARQALLAGGSHAHAMMGFGIGDKVKGIAEGEMVGKAEYRRGGKKDWAEYNRTHKKPKNTAEALHALVDKLNSGSPEEKAAFRKYVTGGRAKAHDEHLSEMSEWFDMLDADGQAEILGMGEKATKTEGGKDGFTTADYADVPDASSPATWKLRLSDSPGHHDVTHVAGAITALQPGGYRGNRVELGGRKSAAISKISGAITSLDAPDETKSSLRDRLAAVKALDEYGDDAVGAFASFKGADDQWRFIATWSNNFFDREGEVFPEQAHKEYERYVDETGDYPELWLWHVPGSKSGKCDMIAYDDGFMLASGTWDADKAQIAESFSKQKGLGVSHGYDYNPFERRNGVYGPYRTFEISPLPAEKAANEGTAFAALKEAPVLNATKRDWLVGIVGEPVTQQIEENHRRMRKSLEDRGVSFKEFVEAVSEAVEPASGVKEITAPGFVSRDGGLTWTATKAKAEGGGGGEKPKGDDEEDDEKDDEAEGDGKGDGAAEGGDGEDGGAKGLTVQGVKEAFAEALAPLTSQIKEMRAEYDEKLSALKESDDAKIARAWARKGWNGRAIASATESESNIAPDEEVNRVKEAMGQADPSPAQPYIEDLVQLVGAGNRAGWSS